MIRVCLLWLCLISAAGAVQPGEQLEDPVLEARAREISAGLRCLVCQNQSIDDSDAPLARDLRLLVRERLQAGDSDAAIEDFLVARYGEFVLLRPRFAWSTALLWLTPGLLLAGGGLVALRRARRLQALDSRKLTEGEEAALSRILHENSTERP